MVSYCAVQSGQVNWLRMISMAPKKQCTYSITQNNFRNTQAGMQEPCYEQLSWIAGQQHIHRESTIDDVD